MIRLGVIIAQHSLKELKTVPGRVQESCEIVMLPYQRLHETIDLYLQNQQHVDGFVLTELAYYYLTEKWGNFPMPTYTFQISKQEFYEKLLQISLSNRNLDFSRIYIDFIASQNNFLGLKQVLNEKDMPLMVSFSQVTDQVYEEVLNEHIQLWQERKIDLSLTRLSNIVEDLVRHEVPHIFLFPSPDSVVQQFEQIISELSLIKLAESQIAIGHITIGNPDTGKQNINEWEFQQMLLHKSLLEFSTEQKVPFLIQKSNGSFELISSYKELKTLTHNLSQCLLMSYLGKVLPFSVHIGWGVDNTMYKARSNAQSANNLSVTSRSPGTYVVTDTDKIIGPLGEGNCLEYLNGVNKSIQRISKDVEISTLQLQKIMAVISKTESNELTAEELAYHLDVTVRSANRILNRLEEKGVARILYKKQEKLRGRPKKIYQIQFAGKG
ncbi:helix-turn-helix domain-containing protein [Peribacillus aracenensis]|uniref:HTH domain-containing protein n=1 Tax=Peribacillus aracenensis TaxID=2976708 RepID=UPI0021A39CFD|nr:HTH domain-containing protein [Peribacillus sp. BBB004]